MGYLPSDPLFLIVRVQHTWRENSWTVSSNQFPVLHPSYVKDIPHMLQILQNGGSVHGEILFTSDVESIYTNIPHTLGSERARRALSQHPQNLSSHAINFLTRLLKIQLELNNFSFEGRRFSQKHGVAMGKSWAPAYANIYMAQWEKDLTQATSHLPQPNIWRHIWHIPRDGLSTG